MKYVFHFLSILLLAGLFVFLPLSDVSAAGADDFVITVKTDNGTIDSYTQFTIPTYSGETYNYNVDCNNDGIDEVTGAVGDYICEYGAAGLNLGAGTYTIRIKDNMGDGTGFPRIYFANRGGIELELLSIEQWGTGKWSSMAYAFQKCILMVGNATDTPNLSNVEDMMYMFSQAYQYNGDMTDWDTSHVTNMSYMFANTGLFNQDIGGWDTGNVTDMSLMFAATDSFNQDIGGWDTRNVTDMSAMFVQAKTFDQNLSRWDVRKVSSFNMMFSQHRLSTTNYDSLLISWSGQAVQSNVAFDAGNSTYCLGEDARSVLVNNYHWTITDGGRDCPVPVIQVLDSDSALIPNGGTHDLEDQTEETIHLQYTVENVGDSYFMLTSLLLDSPSNVSNFQTSTEFPILLFSHESATFDISFDTPAVGEFSASLQILNNSDTNPYVVNISGSRMALPEAPILLGPPDGHSTSDHTPNFDWEDFPGATSYIIQVSPDADFTRKPINHTVTNSFFAPGIAMINQPYYWRVNAIVDSALVGWSEVRTITITGAPGNAAPVAVSPENGAVTSDRTPTFTWTEVDTAVRYRIQLSPLEGFGVWIVNQTVNAPITEWTPGVNFNPGTYWWRVQAEGGGDSSWFTVKRSITIAP